MRMKPALLILVILISGSVVFAQVACTTLGQNPSTAFPVCGTSKFSQTTVPYCGGRSVPGPCSTTDGLTDTNPFWYKFTCFKEGTLGFLITPNDLNDDYDWQLFDITGRDPNDVYTDPKLFVTCNWSGRFGLTGTSATGTSLINCAGTGYPTFSSMPTLKLNHNYLLLVSHFTRWTPSQNGYSLSFGGGTASITDTIPPTLQNAAASCDALTVSVKLNKKMKCATLANNGSDFLLTPALATVKSALGVSCNSGFDMDSITLTLSNPLPPGSYNLSVKNGSDGNTLLDNCGKNIPAGTSVPLTILPLAPTPMDSLVPLKCAPQTLQLVFKKKIRCNSVAADGSDFIVSGPAPVSILAASGNCTNALSNIINVTLSSPIVNAGTYKITLRSGSDGNSIIDECGQQTPAGASINFSVKDTVSADFKYQVSTGCTTDTVQFFHDGRNGVNQWKWQLDYNGTSNLQNPVTYFTSFNDKHISLIVSNGFCSDTASKTISLGNELKAVFETNNLLCPEDAAVFINKSVGNIVSYEWDLKNGNNSVLQTPPPQHYPLLGEEKIYPVRLIVKNNIGCMDTAYQNLKVLKSCYIAVPNAFTPNGDGLNDFLYPLNAYKADHLEFKVYNRLGQLVFSTTDWTVKWDGSLSGQPQDSGIYVWTLKYVNHDTGKPVFMKGSTMLIR
jgi:gliding motility-associated-like protein